ncbi:MAG: hypothetical protein IKL25_03095 [Clostridia bacterium]|nr:hypothetical protein [Clostridia bacterium]
MMTNRLKTYLALLLMLCLLLPGHAALADRADALEDAMEMQTYWVLVGDRTGTDPLTRAMNGDYTSVTLAELRAVTPEALLAFAAANKLPISMARHAYYQAMADRLAAELPEGATGERLALFLAMRYNDKDKAANEERRAIRKTLTQEDINGYAEETGLPAGFLAWLLLDDEWHESEWDDGDDWREGRRDWDFPDWVDESDMRARYGDDAVVTEDDVERILRQNGYRFDD